MISSNKTKGFTLVELLIVIVVIAILAAISIVAYNGITNKARDDERVATARELVNAASAYNSEKDAWPTHEELTKFNTVKLNGNAASTTLVGTAEPTSGDKGKFKYRLCKDGADAASTAEATGVEISFWKDVADNAFKQGVNKLATGKCS